MALSRILRCVWLGSRQWLENISQAFWRASKGCRFYKTLCGNIRKPALKMLGHHVEGLPQLAQRHPRHVIWYTHIRKHTHTPCDWPPVHSSEGQVWDFVDGESTQNTTLAVGLEGKAHIWTLSTRETSRRLSGRKQPGFTGSSEGTQASNSPSRRSKKVQNRHTQRQGSERV